MLSFWAASAAAATTTFSRFSFCVLLKIRCQSKEPLVCRCPSPFPLTSRIRYQWESRRRSSCPFLRRLAAVAAEPKLVSTVSVAETVDMVDMAVDTVQREAMDFKSTKPPELTTRSVGRFRLIGFYKSRIVIPVIKYHRLDFIIFVPLL